MRKEDIVCFANDWHSDPTSKHQVMKLLSRDRKILWINSIGLRRPALTLNDVSRIVSKVRGLVAGVEEITKNLRVLSPLVIPFHKHRFVRRINQKLLVLQIKYFLRKLEMQNIELWSFIPTMGETVGQLGESKVVYYCVDDWSKFSFVDSRSVAEMEADLVRKADIVIASARSLYEQKKELNPNTYLVTHGVDFNHFAKALDDDCPVPEDIRLVQKPVIGFFGLIHEWIDLSLIKKVAQYHPDWSLVMIGKVSTDISGLRELANVIFLGQKGYKELPGYCKAFDVAIIPFVINDLTKSVNPIKLREYLAAGLDVVSVDLPEVKSYDRFVRISRNADEFMNNIELSVTTRSADDQRKKSLAMASEDWESKVAEIGRIVSSSRRATREGALFRP